MKYTFTCAECGRAYSVEKEPGNRAPRDKYCKKCQRQHRSEASAEVQRRRALGVDDPAIYVPRWDGVKSLDVFDYVQKHDDLTDMDLRKRNE